MFEVGTVTSVFLPNFYQSLVSGTVCALAWKEKSSIICGCGRNGCCDMLISSELWYIFCPKNLEKMNSYWFWSSGRTIVTTPLMHIQQRYTGKSSKRIEVSEYFIVLSMIITIINFSNFSFHRHFEAALGTCSSPTEPALTITVTFLFPHLKLLTSRHLCILQKVSKTWLPFAHTKSISALICTIDRSVRYKVESSIAVWKQKGRERPPNDTRLRDKHLHFLWLNPLIVITIPDTQHLQGPPST